MSRLTLSCILATAGIILGAFGAHALKEMLTANDMVKPWETAVLYHLVHSVALFSLACASDRIKSRWATRLWVAGILMFSGSLYLIALGGPKILGPITPLGGLAFIAGWIMLAVENRKQ